MTLIKFNDTNDYESITVLGKPGVFTRANIDPATLPEGFRKYQMEKGDDNSFVAIADHLDDRERGGDFITTEDLNLVPDEKKSLTHCDYTYTKEAFQMETFFGKKESIDLQIHQAQEKRDRQVQDKERENPERENSHQEPAFL